jgi:hypothetical protein
MVRYAGADPGFSGAIALLTEDGRDIEYISPLQIIDYYSPTELKKKDPKKRKSQKHLDVKHLQNAIKLIDALGEVHFALESVHAFGNNNANALWQLSGSYHAIKQALESTSITTIPFVMCDPNKWKSIYPLLNNSGKGIEEKNDRTKVINEAAIATVQEVFPNSWQKICPPHKSRKGVFNAPNPNWADAVLLANYAKHCYESSLSMATAKVA